MNNSDSTICRALGCSDFTLDSFRSRASDCPRNATLPATLPSNAESAIPGLDLYIREEDFATQHISNTDAAESHHTYVPNYTETADSTDEWTQRWMTDDDLLFQMQFNNSANFNIDDFAFEFKFPNRSAILTSLP
jgi:hypothetical protein